VSSNGVVQEDGVRRGGPEKNMDRLIALGRALSDPIRVRMLGMMAEGRSRCAPRPRSISTAAQPLADPQTGERTRVLFLCTHNSARSQMAEGFLRNLAGGRFEVFSAGTEATRVRREAISVMAEVGEDISAQESKTLERYLREPFDLLITVCDDANEACPISFPGQRNACTGPFPTPHASRSKGASRHSDGRGTK
jgi:arsenate reductase (thioredoxin)